MLLPLGIAESLRLLIYELAFLLKYLQILHVLLNLKRGGNCGSVNGVGQYWMIYLVMLEY